MELIPYTSGKRGDRGRDIACDFIKSASPTWLAQELESLAPPQFLSARDAIRIATAAMRYCAFALRQPECVTPGGVQPDRFVGDTYDTVVPASVHAWGETLSMKTPPQSISFGGWEVKIPSVTATEAKIRPRLARFLEDANELLTCYRSELIDQHCARKGVLDERLNEFLHNKLSILEGKIEPSGSLSKGRLFPEVIRTLDSAKVCCQECLQQYCGGCLQVNWLTKAHGNLAVHPQGNGNQNGLKQVPTKELWAELKRRQTNPSKNKSGNKYPPRKRISQDEH